MSKGFILHLQTNPIPDKRSFGDFNKHPKLFFFTRWKILVRYQFAEGKQSSVLNTNTESSFFHVLPTRLFLNFLSGQQQGELVLLRRRFYRDQFSIQATYVWATNISSRQTTPIRGGKKNCTQVTIEPRGRYARVGCRACSLWGLAAITADTSSRTRPYSLDHPRGASALGSRARGRVAFLRILGFWEAFFLFLFTGVN